MILYKTNKGCIVSRNGGTFMIKCTVFYGTFLASKKCAIKLLYPISDDKVVREKYFILFSIYNEQ